MARRKIVNSNVRKILRTGGSLFITLPISMIKELKWRSKQKVTVKKRGNKLIIQDWEK